MILNGDGKTNIHHEDSLSKINANRSSCWIVICNPPFGTKIAERRKQVLESFDLGHEWEQDEHGRWRATSRPLDKQESGVLFAETCAQMIQPGGRFALIVPNGYLGNRSQRYLVLREWLLRHCRIAVIVGLPRFTFKGSGADVSASVIFCERREEPLKDSADSEEYEFCVEIIDRVGWKLGDKRGAPLYRRDPEDGTYVLDEKGQPILDSEFSDVLARIRASDAAQYFPWLTTGLPLIPADAVPGWSVSSSDVLAEESRILDPKRHSRKMSELRSQIISAPHFRLGDVASFMPESPRCDPGKIYRHVEIADVGIGTYRWQVRRGWELPSRARHRAEPGDIYVGSIWSSVSKWFLAPDNTADMIVTNGLHRLRLRPGKADLLLDLVTGLCSEAYTTQMRGFARGSDGLAEIASEDAADVVLPLITDEAVRAEMQPFIIQIRAGLTSVEAKVSALLMAQRLPLPTPPPRPDHTSII